MKVCKLDSPVLVSLDCPVRLKEAGNILEIMYSEKRSKGGYITKLDKDYFVDNRTGELKEFNHIENRSQDLSNVAKSLAHGRDMINANVIDVSHCRWITLTYAENMTDSKKLYYDFKNFNKRCRALFGHYEYIIAAEPQERGAWHLHCIFIFPDKAPFMPNDVVRDCWKKGFVTVKKIDNVDNVGAYLTAYLGDYELPAVLENVKDLPYKIKEVEVADENGVKKSKKYIKGGRLHLYPPGFHIFRWSRGVKKPEVSIVSYKEAKKKASAATLTFSKTVSLEDVETDFKNTLQYEYYNSKRYITQKE